MAFFKVEDLMGAVEVIAFPEFYANHLATIAVVKDSPEPLLITGEWDVKEGEPKILATQIQKLEDAHSGRVVTVIVEIDPKKVVVDH